MSSEPQKQSGRTDRVSEFVNEVDKMRHLYEVEKLTLKEIGIRFGLSKQTVHNRLKKLNVKFRPFGSTRAALDLEALQRLYVDEQLKGSEIAKRIGRSPAYVYDLLRKYEIPIRTARECLRKYPELGTLNVGESIIVPRPKGPAKYQHNYYPKAKRFGIRVSVRTLDGERVQLTRIA